MDQNSLDRIMNTCHQCGEEYYDGKIMLDIERILDSRYNIEKVISVSVMKYNAT